MENIQTTSKRNLPRDLFLHLLAIVALYWSSISFTTLLWQFINYFFQENLDYFYYETFAALVRFSVSSLFIIFPVFILVSWFLNKIYTKELEVRDSKIRKWLIYFTLFVSALVIIGDLITVVNFFLGGEIAIKFILKSLSIFLVAGVVFGYYLDDVRRATPTPLAKYFAWVSSILVAVTIIASFFIIGSPTTAKMMQADQQRVSDLSSIQDQIVKHWQAKEKLPATLSDLNDPISGFVAPKDPQTNADYEYIIVDAEKLSFQLCATFSRESKLSQSDYIYYYGSGAFQFWDHKVGRVCFDRTIDKDLYPINTQKKEPLIAI
jgi:hypothetical protein